MWIAANAVSSPVTPSAACSKGTSLRSAGCGAWSVAMQSMVPAAALDQRLAIGFGPQRGFILNRESRLRTSSSVSVRWCGVASQVIRDAPPFARGDHLDGLDRREMLHVDTGVFERGERAVAGDHRRLGDRRHPVHPEHRRDLALVHDAGAREFRILFVEGHLSPPNAWYCSARRITRALANRHAVVGEANGAGLSEFGVVGQLFPVHPSSHGRDESGRHAGIGRARSRSDSIACGVSTGGWVLAIALTPQ